MGRRARGWSSGNAQMRSKHCVITRRSCNATGLAGQSLAAGSRAGHVPHLQFPSIFFTASKLAVIKVFTIIEYTCWSKLDLLPFGQPIVGIPQMSVLVLLSEGILRAKRQVRMLD